MNRMNLKDRFRDEAWAMEQFAKSEYAFVAVHGENGFPYNIPLCLVKIGNDLYFHTALKGLAVDLFRLDGRVCVTCATHASRDPRNTTMRFRSAMAFGNVYEVTDPVEKTTAMLRFFEKYIPGDARSDAYAQRAAIRAAVWRISVHEAVGKENALQ